MDARLWHFLGSQRVELKNSKKLLLRLKTLHSLPASLLGTSEYKKRDWNIQFHPQ